MLVVHARLHEASLLASELTGLLESIGDPTLTLGLLYTVLGAKYRVGEIAEALRLAQCMMDLADGDPIKGDVLLGSPLAGGIMLRGCARCCLGDPGWRSDIDTAATIVRAFDAPTRAVTLNFKYALTVPDGVLVPDAAARQETAELLDIAERSGHDFTLANARFLHGLTLVTDDGPQRGHGFAMLAAAREAAVEGRFSEVAAPIVDTLLATEQARTGDLDGAIELSRAALEADFGSGHMMAYGPATAVLVEALLRRGECADMQEAQAAIDRLAEVPTEPGFILHDIWLLRLRAFAAQAGGDDAAYCDYRDRYRAMANSLGFEGHMKWAGAMT